MGFSLSTLILVLSAIAAAQTPPKELPVFTDVTEQAGIRFKQSFGDLELSNIVEGTGTGAGPWRRFRMPWRCEAICPRPTTAAISAWAAPGRRMPLRSAGRTERRRPYAMLRRINSLR